MRRPKESLFFPNLNGLRFLAALLVIIQHLEQVKDLLHYPNAFNTPGILVIGKLGVVLFFVLSGFLITYLMLEEERLSGTISVSRFYVRRILRIWPLYYLVVVLGLWVLPWAGFLQIQPLSQQLHQHFATKAALYLTILPNLAFAMFPPVLFLAQAWSVGTEEQFYLTWPVLMKHSGRRRLLLFLSVIAGYLLVARVLAHCHAVYRSQQAFGVAEHFWGMFNIDCMAMGAIVAWCSFHDVKPVLRVLTHRVTEVGAVCAAVLCMALGVRFPVYHYESYGVIFAIIILNAARNPRTVIRLENPVFNYLGKVSYGIYMYHVLAIVIVVKASRAIGFSSYLTELVASVVVVVAISALSYEFIEARFLRLKARFSKVISGDMVRRG